ncbi:hypothetical protein CYMTET_36421, partial [Cymbomonas tetramitiformis]
SRLEFIFTIIFVVELALKLYSYRARYFSDASNNFDFFIVTLSLTEVLFAAAPNVKFLQTFRVLRLVRIIRNVKGVYPLFQSVLRAVKALKNMLAVLTLVFYVYALAGVSLFGEADYGAFINQHNNFSSFGPAMLLLFRCGTGESWNGIMHELDSQGYALAVMYMMSFVVLVQSIMLNIVMGIVLDKYLLCQKEYSRVMGQDAIDNFLQLWQQYDPLGTGLILVPQIHTLMFRLKQPIGISKTCWKAATFLPILHTLKIPVMLKNVKSEDARREKPATKRIHCVTFQDVLESIAGRVYEKETINMQLRSSRCALIGSCSSLFTF